MRSLLVTFCTIELSKMTPRTPISFNPSPSSGRSESHFFRFYVRKSDVTSDDVPGVYSIFSILFKQETSFFKIPDWFQI